MTNLENPMPRIAFVRKPSDLDEVFTDHGIRTDALPVPTEIVETISLSTDNYDRFAATLLKDRDWLAGKGGWKRDGTRLAVAVTAPGRRNLFETAPPRRNRRFLESRLGYRIQEIEYGGLKPATIKRLEALGEALDGGKVDLRRRPATRGHPPDPRVSGRRA